MSITENLKAVIDDLDLERRMTELGDQAESTVNRALTRAGELAHERRDDLEGYLTRAQSFVDDRTDGKYADTVVKVRDQVSHGIAKLAEQRNRPSA